MLNKFDTNVKLWGWTWNEGGYNHCWSPNRNDAILVARQMCQGINLTVNITSVKEVSQQWIDDNDRQYAGMFN